VALRRAVYFLQEVQHYTLRNTALLLGMSDAEVDQLKKSAKKRMGFPEDPPEPEFHCRTHPLATIRSTSGLLQLPSHPFPMPNLQISKTDSIGPK